MAQAEKEEEVAEEEPAEVRKERGQEEGQPRQEAQPSPQPEPEPEPQPQPEPEPEPEPEPTPQPGATGQYGWLDKQDIVLGRNVVFPGGTTRAVFTQEAYDEAMAIVAKDEAPHRR